MIFVSAAWISFCYTDFETKKLHDITKENEAFLNDIQNLKCPRILTFQFDLNKTIKNIFDLRS